MSEWALAREGDDPDRAGPSRLFASPHWAHALEGLDCKVVRVWHETLQVPVVVPVFRRGPLRIGFLGFPMAGGAFDAMSDAEFERQAIGLAQRLRLDIVRGTRCGRESPLPGECLPEVWTDDLAHWPGPLGKRLGRDLAFAERACAELRVADSGGDPQAWYGLYAGTVRAHGGNLRYTAEYFHRLALAGERGAGVRTFHATDGDGRTLGFAVLAMHLDTGYYLHGGVDPSVRKAGLSDLLLSRAIVHAREQGLQRFSLMASPAAQTGLLRFKRKWADRQGWSVTRDFGFGLAGKAALGARGLLQAARRRVARRS